MFGNERLNDAKIEEAFERANDAWPTHSEARKKVDKSDKKD